LAKERGVWDEFYGTGKKRKRQGKGQRKEGAKENEGEDASALQALTGSFLDNLAATYVEPEKSSTGQEGRKKHAGEKV